MSGSNVKRDICLYCCLFFTVIVLSVLLALSYSITEIDQITLAKNIRTQKISYKAEWALPGRHFTGLETVFIPFKRTRYLVNFANDSQSPNSTTTSDVIASGGNRLSCWTKDGTNVYLDLSYHFSLVRENLLGFYLEFGEKWLDFVVRLSYSVIKQTTTEYTTEDFFVKRNDIQTNIKTSLQTEFNSKFSKAVKVNSMQLRRIDFDDTFENATISKLIQFQKKKSFENNRQVNRIKKETDKVVSEKQNQINLILAEGRAEAVKKRDELISGAYKKLIIAFNKAYKVMKDSSIPNIGADLKKYIYAMEIQLIGNFNSVVIRDSDAVRRKTS